MCGPVHSGPVSRQHPVVLHLGVPPSPHGRVALAFSSWGIGGAVQVRTVWPKVGVAPAASGVWTAANSGLEDDGQGGEPWTGFERHET